MRERIHLALRSNLDAAPSSGMIRSSAINDRRRRHVCSRTRLWKSFVTPAEKYGGLYVANSEAAGRRSNTINGRPQLQTYLPPPPPCGSVRQQRRHPAATGWRRLPGSVRRKDLGDGRTMMMLLLLLLLTLLNCKTWFNEISSYECLNRMLDRSRGLVWPGQIRSGLARPDSRFGSVP